VEELLLGLECLQASWHSMQNFQLQHYSKNSSRIFLKTSGSQELLPVNHLGTFSGYTCRKLVQSDPD